MSYNFSTLNDKDLEELTLDILSKKLNTDFQSFKMGADKGIDLRYALSGNENEIIVQVKHYLDSGISKLISDLKKKEVSKVKNLNPKRYILVTSLPLNPQRKEEIKAIFQPFIITTNDILGKNELNYFLRNNPEIETAHFKLWLSSTNVLKRILNNGIKGRSEFFDKKIKDRIKIFVPSKTHKNAVEILNKYNFILITGAPGIGKSTLANMLTYQLLAKDFELIYVREIKEAEDLYMPGKKQVFYFDDFLGSITLDLTSSRNADSAIINFTERVKSDKQKRLILTCRTTILNQAKEESEKIGSSKIEISNYEVKIEDYRDIDKARILYNHIYFSNLTEELKSVFFKDSFYWQVIKHRHYNPRIIEFFTDVERLQPDIEYKKEVIDFLNDPSRIWEKLYTIQISQNARLFLSTLYSLGQKYVIQENRIKEAFEARLDYEVANNNYVKNTNVINKVIKELVGGLIIRTHKTEGDYISIEYRFLNPSIQDFLYYHFTKNIEEYFIILKSAIYFEQFKGRISAKLENGSKKIFFGEKKYSAKLLKIFLERLPNLKAYVSNKDLETVIVLINLFEWQSIDKKVIEIMNNLNIDYLGWGDRENLIEILDYIAENNLIDSFSLSIEEILFILSDSMSYYFQIEAFSNLISKYTVYNQIIKNAKISHTEYYTKLQSNIDESWTKSIEYYITQTANLNSIISEQDLINTIVKRKQEAKRINELLNMESSPIIDKYTFDYQAQLNKNMLINLEKETEIKNLQKDGDEHNEPMEINRLFDSQDTNEYNSVPF